MVSLVDCSFRVTDEHSNEENLGQEVETTGKWSRIKKAVPPPRLGEEDLGLGLADRGKLRRVKPRGTASIS